MIYRILLLILSQVKKSKSCNGTNDSCVAIQNDQRAQLLIKNKKCGRPNSVL